MSQDTTTRPHNKFYPSKLDGSKQFKTDVFILDACSPDHLSFRRDRDGSKENIKVLSRKLSINTNRFSAFRIDGINPLRYSFYINNQSVTQFVDANDVIVGNFKKDTADIQASNIDILDIFHPDTIKEKQPDASTLKDSIEKLQTEITETNNNWYQAEAYILTLIPQGESPFGPKLTAKDPKMKKALDSAKVKYDTYGVQYEKLNEDITNEMKKYTIYLSNLVINNNVEGIIRDISSNSLDTNGSTGVLKKTGTHLKDQSENTLRNIEVVTRTLKSLQEINSSFRYSIVTRPVIDTGARLNTLQNNIDTVLQFAFNKSFTILRSEIFRNNTQGELERNKTLEFITNEKLNQVNYFVLYSSLQIGKLLQNAFTDNSRLINKLNSKNCISSEDDSIGFYLANDIQIYNYIQSISSSLNVLINYAQLNNPAFNSTIKGINEDYKTFLKYIKVLDFLSDNNTEQFTLPSSTNLRNVDLVRYSVEKRDRISGRLENYTYDLWLKGGLKVDFSVAILMSGLRDYVYNKDALFKVSDTANSGGTFESTQRTDSFLIKRASAGRYNFAFGGMVNVMLRSGASWITPGASIGIAYGSATESKLQFLGALSLQFGKSERVIAHFGIVAGEAKRLDVSQLSYNPIKDISEGGDTYKVKGDFSTTSIPTAPKFMFKPFFGISYSLSKKNALNAVGANADNYNSALPK
jgi:hypothetical protein